jgi:hypothetical protein
MTSALINRNKLSAHDKCDRCGVQARVRASFLSGDLYFCGHHAKLFNVSQKAFELELYDASEKFRF